MLSPNRINEITYYHLDQTPFLFLSEDVTTLPQLELVFHGTYLAHKRATAHIDIWHKGNHCQIQRTPLRVPMYRHCYTKSPFHNAAIQQMKAKYTHKDLLLGFTTNGSITQLPSGALVIKRHVIDHTGEQIKTLSDTWSNKPPRIRLDRFMHMELTLEKRRYHLIFYFESGQSKIPLQVILIDPTHKGHVKFTLDTEQLSLKTLLATIKEIHSR